jgi:dienelactone hydrolase
MIQTSVLKYEGDGAVLTDRTAIMERIQGFMAEPLRIRARARAALDALHSQADVDASRTAAIGYC